MCYIHVGGALDLKLEVEEILEGALLVFPQEPQTNREGPHQWPKV